MTSIIVDDIFNELISENRELLEDLIFANDLIDCLQRLRNCLIDFNSKCDCVHNRDNKAFFQLLDNKYQKLVKEKQINRVTTYCSRLSYLDQLLRKFDKNRVHIKQEPIDREIKSEPTDVLPILKNSKRNGYDLGENSRTKKKRKSVTFAESNNIINEYEVKSTNRNRLANIFEEQLFIKSDKMSTNLTKDEISQKVANDECIARIDSNQQSIKSIEYSL